MKEFILRNKAFLGIVVATLVILFGGIALMSKSGTDTSNIKSVNDQVLISDDSHQSDPTAPLKLVEFGDYQCPACGVYHPFVKQLLVDFPGKINFIFRHFPLTQHKNANSASYAVEAAAIQGKFIEMHNKIYESQNVWSNLESPIETFTSYALELGLNKDKFIKDMNSDIVKNIIKRGLSDGNLAGINATPTFFMNGSELPLVGSYDELKKIVEDKLKTL